MSHVCDHLVARAVVEHGYAHIQRGQVMSHGVGRGAAVTDADGVLFDPPGPASQCARRDGNRCVGAGVDLRLGGDPDGASRGGAGAGSCNTKRLPSNRAAVDRPVDLILAVAGAGAGALFDRGDGLFKLGKGVGVQRARHGAAGSIPHIDPVLRCGALRPHQHPILAGHRDAINGGARAAQVEVGLGCNAAGVLPGKTFDQRVDVGLWRCVAGAAGRREVDDLGDRLKIKIGKDFLGHVRSASQNQQMVLLAE